MEVYTRVAFEPGPDGGALVAQHTRYYPYGMRMAGTLAPQTTASGNEYLYNGKELADEFGLNWYHYGARYYDVALARWAEMDPADEFHTPYTYVGGDPVNLVDPDGRQVCSPSESAGFVCAAIEEGAKFIRSGTERVVDSVKNSTLAFDITMRINTSSWDAIDGSPEASSESLSMGLAADADGIVGYIERGSGSSWGTGGVMFDAGLDFFPMASIDNVLSDSRNIGGYIGGKYLNNVEVSLSADGTRSMSLPIDDALDAAGMPIDGVGGGINVYDEESSTVARSEKNWGEFLCFGLCGSD